MKGLKSSVFRAAGAAVVGLALHELGLNELGVFTTGLVYMGSNPRHWVGFLPPAEAETPAEPQSRKKIAAPLVTAQLPVLKAA